jgi:HEAT repeat protein
MIESTVQAIALLQNDILSELEREDAIHYLRDHPSPEAIEALVTALDDDDAGVRWSAGAALATLGEAALPTLLEALSKSPDVRLMEAARHVLHYNTSAKVRDETQELMRALKGPEAALATEVAARKLLWELK